MNLLFYWLNWLKPHWSNSKIRSLKMKSWLFMIGMGSIHPSGCIFSSTHAIAGMILGICSTNSEHLHPNRTKSYFNCNCTSMSKNQVYYSKLEICLLALVSTENKTAFPFRTLLCECWPLAYFFGSFKFTNQPGLFITTSMRVAWMPFHNGWLISSAYVCVFSSE